jgi:hypothetical protein
LLVSFDSEVRKPWLPRHDANVGIGTPVNFVITRGRAQGLKPRDIRDIGSQPLRPYN